MISINKMSTSGMDINESFRAEVLSKADYLDLVDSTPNIGIDVTPISLHTDSYCQQKQEQHRNQKSNSHPAHNNGNVQTDTSANIDSNNSINSNINDKTTPTHEYWNSDKNNSPLMSTIFEDLDRYCWQQQHLLHTAQKSSQIVSPQLNEDSNVNSAKTSRLCQRQLHNEQQNNGSGHSSSGSSNSAIGSGGVSTVSSSDTSNEQNYTLTVLNGNESWLKPNANDIELSAISVENQLSNNLDIDSLLNNFSSLIKSEYLYEDNRFNNGEPKSGNTTTVSTDGVDGTQSTQSMPALDGSNMTKDSGINDVDIMSFSEQLAQFHNNNNDWHMVDYNADQNCADSLLRNALQGKCYTKGLHVQNGSLKNDEIWRVLFPSEIDPMTFADPSTCETDTYNGTQKSVSGAEVNVSLQLNKSTDFVTHERNRTGTIMVDDAFIPMEKNYDDMQQSFCSANDSNSVAMSINRDDKSIIHVSPPSTMQQLKIKSDVAKTTTISNRHSIICSNNRQPTKKYKRHNSLNTQQYLNTNNNNNPSMVSHNVTGSGNGVSVNSSNLITIANNINNTTNCNSQRKERSLHYCSICSKGFKDKYSVNVHIRTHTGEKPFACSLCGKSFRQKAHLAKHYQTHMAQKNISNNINKSSSNNTKSHRNNNKSSNNIPGNNINRMQQHILSDTNNGTHGNSNSNSSASIITQPVLNVIDALPTNITIAKTTLISSFGSKV